MNRVRRDGPAVGYGVVLAGEETLVVRCRRSRGRIESRVVVHTEAPAAEVAALPAVMEMQAEAAAGHALVNAGIPAGAGLVRWLQTPFASRTKARRVLPSLLDIQLPFPLEQCAHALVQVAPDEQGKVRALAVAARLTELTGLLETARERGIDPTLMDHEALALWEQAAPAEQGGVLAVACLGQARGMLVIGEGGQLVSAHALPGAAPDNVDTLRSRLQHVLRSRRADPDRAQHWVWTGPAAADPGVRDPLESALAQEWPQMSFRVTPEPASFLADALARRALAGDPGSTWNLRRGDLEHPALAIRRGRAVRRTAAAAAAAGIALIAVNLGWRTVLDRRGQALDARILEQARQMTGLSDAVLRMEPVHVVRTHLASRAGPADPFREIMTPGATEALFRATELAARLQLTLHTFSASEGAFSLSGSGPDAAGCRRFEEQWAADAPPLDFTLQSEPNARPAVFTARGVYGPS